jgi:hypothetical protein
MKKRYITWTALVVVFFAILLVSSCWLLGITLTITHDIEDEIVSTDTHFNSVAVDLTKEEDWRDNQDKLDEIYVAYFYGWVHNYESTPATGKLYVYKDTTLHTLAEVESKATLVLGGLVFPPDTTMEVPIAAMKLEPIKDLIKEGKFALYMLAENTPFDIRVFDASVVVIFAVEP